MTRIKGGRTSHRRHKKLLRQAKGFYGGRHRLYRPAHETVLHAMASQYRDRRLRKRNFRRLWITRINAAARQQGMTYSVLMNGLHRAGIQVNRKMLAELAVKDKAAFAGLVEQARAAL